MPADATSSVTFAQCTSSARRLLEFAETETDLEKMNRFEKLAYCWLALATTISGHEDLRSDP